MYFFYLICFIINYLVIVIAVSVIKVYRGLEKFFVGIICGLEFERWVGIDWVVRKEECFRYKKSMSEGFNVWVIWGVEKVGSFRVE